MAFKFPFTNYHELNLTWVLEQLKKLFEESEENVETIETYDNRLSAVETEVTDLESTTTQAINTANAAATNAATALSRANTANENALTAGSQAGAAVTAAQDALQEAQAATQAAQQAQATAMTFDGRITQAQNDASAAVHEAESFENRVNAAVNTANNAANTATIAQGIAVNANQTAAQALDELNAQRDELVAISEEQQTAIEETAERVIASIPSDYSDLTDKVDGLNNLISTDDEITWNQLATRFTRASGNLAGVTYTKSADEKQATFNGTPTTADFFQLIQFGLGTSVVGHKYAIFTPRVSGSVNGYYFFYLNDRNVKDIGNGAIWTANTASSIVVGIEWYATPSVPTFNNLTINIPIITDLTECFGAGNEPTIEEFRAMFPNDTYTYDSGTQRKLTQIEKNSLDIYHNKFVVLKTQSNVKLKILTFNCGHYNYGSPFEYSGDDMQDKILEWKKMLAKYKPDIMFGQEMSVYFDNAQTVNAINQIFKPLLPNYYYGNYTKLVSKFELIQTWQEIITVTVSGTTYTRPFTCASINVNGVEIILCSIHMTSGYSADDTAIREAMRDAVITAFQNYQYVIIGGDFNESADSFFTPFEASGYSLANHGYFGVITTLPNESVDNIIVKGFTLYDAVSNSDDACTSDHYPFASEIHII